VSAAVLANRAHARTTSILAGRRNNETPIAAPAVTSAEAATNAKTPFSAQLGGRTPNDLGSMGQWRSSSRFQSNRSARSESSSMSASSSSRSRERPGGLPSLSLREHFGRRVVLGRGAGRRLGDLTSAVPSPTDDGVNMTRGRINLPGVKGSAAAVPLARRAVPAPLRLIASARRLAWWRRHGSGTPGIRNHAVFA
jgi:hypothetical protein